jgi:hypothetical protein
MCVPVAVCYSRRVERSSKLCEGVEHLDDVTGLERLDNVIGVRRDGEGSNKAEERGGLGCLSLGFGFGRSKTCDGYDGPWAVIFIVVGGFAVKMGYLFCWYPTICQLTLGTKNREPRTKPKEPGTEPN